ncbi:MAG: VanZ family protein [Candidatus Cloacimonetes bacterium]|nr:VanZ family protein [Candidatus Cloacimonadota bacterium]
MKRKKPKNNAARINMALYTFLLIATPFLLVRNYLQQAVGMLSQLSFSVAGMNIPYVLSAAILALLLVIIINIRHLRLLHLLVILITIILMGIGQSSTDYYFNHDFYELQHNWHYFAYGIFAWISYLYHKSINTSRVKYIWFTSLQAVLISVFDEGAQIFISGRVFDICDNGKDIWGTMVGLIIVLLLTRDKEEKIKLLYRKPLANLQNPWSSMFILLLFSYIFLNISSILTESRYIPSAILWSFIVYIPLILLLFFLQFRWSRVAVIVLLATIVVSGSITIKKNSTNIIIQKQAGRLSWRGIPVPWFDLMVQTDGVPKLVDKKIYFNKKDKINRIYGLCEDIMLIGSGTKGQGGKGFSSEKSYFVFNPITRRPLQILVYPNLQACRIYNQLQADGKKVLLIIHNG